MSTSMSHFKWQLEALMRESTITTKQLKKQDAVIQLLKDDNAHLKNEYTHLNMDIQKFNDCICTLTYITLRVFLDAYLAVKGYIQMRFEYLLNTYQDVNVHTVESWEVALAIEAMDEGKLEFSMLFKECMGHPIKVEIHKCVPLTCIDGRAATLTGLGMRTAKIHA
ncbi:uncharacterized protein LACBIDRAFT_325470 [Laccaria bicolor S238N-H82]|uniref:Predicted protein n=1 Tax=Laccaria bicolor (strain S238N-H82 / ATCC MYA-4686) TaxID=486041 RepID=B0D515_LACBS|nr:uncharacterized protein LACBIDRAFT_325470 [Laccaria bicolor S238N-H82]EDR10440.1 predicted protein [Laccaria bicolor S238N-H82]|eukprot:XP_001878890.1 predicted protein [Laccaria bicolor S238N-H82]